MKTAAIIITVVLLLALTGAIIALRPRNKKQGTRLVKSQRMDEAGHVKRIYLKRPGLKAKVWFERSTTNPATFDIHHSGDLQGYTVTTLTNEPLHLVEAREGLSDLGLELGTCSWMQLAKKAVDSGAD